MKLMEEHKLPIIGSTEVVEVAGIKDIPAKIDTGADTSAIWASNIDMGEDGVLTFTLFSEKSPLYTGKKLKSSNYLAKIVRSSNGHTQVRYRVNLPVKINGQSFETTFTLSDRSRNNFPILIGKRTISGKFLVDVSKSVIFYHSNPNTPRLNCELKDNPYKFHQKYFAQKRGKI